MFLLCLTAPEAQAQSWSGSLRLDYQSASSEIAGAPRAGTLSQQYYLRLNDRLFYKNDLSLIGNFIYRTGQAGQPVEFHPRYELQLSSYGYSGRIAYEPYTNRQTVGNPETVRLWRSNIFVQPARWPRFSYDLQRTRQERPEAGIGRNRWDSYVVAWQPRTASLNTSFVRQVQTSTDSTGRTSTAQTVEVYRISGGIDQTLPGKNRLSLGYNFDRTWQSRSARGASTQNQHTPTASLYGQPLPSLTWTAQYSGRFVEAKTVDSLRAAHSADHLGTAVATYSPLKALSLALSRYFSSTAARVGEPPQKTDYWQGRTSVEGRFYRQIRAVATMYRIVYIGARQGARYNDAYFISIHGRPHVHAEWSTEATFSDRHGTVAERYSANINMYMRLYPSAGSQWQLGYATVAVSPPRPLNFYRTEESFTTNMQYFPDPNINLSAGVTVRRSPRTTRTWDVSWSTAVSYRWPSFASVSINYSARETPPSPGQSAGSPGAAQAQMLLADASVWLGPRTTINLSYSRRTGKGARATDSWGGGLSAQF